MKTPFRTEAARRPSGTRLPFSALFTLALLAAPLAAEPTEAPKDHALFLGTSLMIENSGRYLELVGATDSSVTVLADGAPRDLPRKAVDAVRIEPALKLSSIVARIDNLKSTTVKADVRGDRWAADRMQILMDSMAAQNTHMMDHAQRRLENAEAVATVATGFGKMSADAELAIASANYAKLVNTNAKIAQSVGSFVPSDGTVTAVEVECELSSPRVARNAYALLVTEYRMSSREKPQYKVHVQALRRLGPKPERVTLLQSGLPAGFDLGRVDVHVYADGQELATNLSEQRVDLTADDALRYLVLCYVAGHAKDTLPAAPLKIAVPAEFKQQVQPAELDRTLYVTVGADGAVRDLSLAPDRVVAPDFAVAAAVRKFRYNPALKEGKPVESVVPLKLADYVR